MDAKEKAIELVNKMRFERQDLHENSVAIECAIICVDEIINIIKPTDEYLSINAYYLNEKFVSDMEFNVYWQSVKAHIEEM